MARHSGVAIHVNAHVDSERSLRRPAASTCQVRVLVDDSDQSYAIVEHKSVVVVRIFMHDDVVPLVCNRQEVLTNL